MGIRNLALCLVHVPSTQSSPLISHWKRVTVSQKPMPDAEQTESFEPIEYAAKAYSLMKTALEEYNPHTILIERQRYRSGGGAAVQEWTVRVNMLESMFHAVLYTLSQQPPCTFTVQSILPRRMTQFWLADIQEKMNSRETKLAKIALAEKICGGEEIPIAFTGEAEEVARTFNQTKRGEAATKKFDDLADSMLQGLGWWRWDVHRRRTLNEIMSQEVLAASEEKVKAAGKSSKKGSSKKLALLA
jgi:cruciform cutting endonuclease 1